MIRHGQASFGTGNYDKLSGRGIVQSRVLAEHILKINSGFTKIITGTMSRHKETLEPLLLLYKERGMALPDVDIMNEFNEYDFLGIISEIFPLLLKEDSTLSTDMSELLGDKKAFQQVFEKAILGWASGIYDSPRLPKWQDFMLRINNGINAIMKAHGSGAHIAVFTSGGPIAGVLRNVLQISEENAVRLSWQIANASVTRFKFTFDRVTLSTFNEYSYLESYKGENLVTYR